MKLWAMIIACFAVTALKAEDLQMQFNPWGGTGTDYQLIDDSKLTAYTPQLGDVITVRVAGMSYDDINDFSMVIIDNREEVDYYAEFSDYEWAGNITAGVAFDYEISLTITKLSKGEIPLVQPKLVFNGKNAALAGVDGTGTFLTLTLDIYDVSIDGGQVAATSAGYYNRTAGTLNETPLYEADEVATIGIQFANNDPLFVWLQENPARQLGMHAWMCDECPNNALNIENRPYPSAFTYIGNNTYTVSFVMPEIFADFPHTALVEDAVAEMNYMFFGYDVPSDLWFVYPTDAFPYQTKPYTGAQTYTGSFVYGVYVAAGEDNYDSSTPNSATRGYINAPYTRYEAENGTLADGAQMTSRSFNQNDLQFEGSDGICAKTPNGSSIEWDVTGDFNRLGIVLRFSILTDRYDRYENKVIKNADVDVYVNGIKEGTMTLSNKYTWKDLPIVAISEDEAGEGNYGGKTNNSWRMRFDEEQFLVKKSYPEGASIKLVSKSNDLYIDFIEVESVPDPITFASLSNAVQYTGTGSNLQTFINSNQGKTIFIPEGKYDVATQIQLKDATTNNTKVQGAGMWYTQIHFTSMNANNGGFEGLGNGNLSDLYLTTNQNKRYGSYKALWGSFGSGTVERVWAEHFVCGAWIANYAYPWEGLPYADGLTVRHCRFRNNYADGINLCIGSRNCVVEYCHFRNNGDDDMAMYSANDFNDNDRGPSHNNTFRYCTAENNWMASSCAVFGGYGNKFEYLRIKDTYDGGLRANGDFPGYEMDETKANNVFSNIDIINAGTSANPYFGTDAALDVSARSPWWGLKKIVNTELNCIYIKNSRTEGITITGAWDNDISNFAPLKNITFNGITIDGTRAGYSGVSVTSNNLTNVTFCGTFANIGNGINIGGWASSSLITQTSDCISCESVAVTSVNITPTSKTMDEGETFTAIATVLPATATNKDVTWSSSDATIASVSATGLVTAQKAGTAKITVKTADGNKTAECTVTVTSTTDISDVLTAGTLKIYPNPVLSGALIVELPAFVESETVQIYDLDGKWVLTRTAYRPKTEIDISCLADGTYIVKVGNTTNKIVIAKK